MLSLYQPEAPVVVIGSGLSGMAAALALSRFDLPVMILEASDSVGGCCSTTCVSGFSFNNGAVYVAVPSLLRAAFDHLGLDLDVEAPLVQINQPHETHLDDGAVVQLSNLADSHVYGPGARRRTAMLRDGLAALQEHWGPVYRALVNDVLPFEPSLPRTLTKIWRYLPRMSGKVDQVIATHFADEGLRSAVASTLLYTGAAPDRLPATQIIGLMALLEEGFYLPRAGMGAITDALLRALQRQSVPVRLGARVDRIEVVNGRVEGVRLANGDHIAAKHVVATCSGFEVLDRMLSKEVVPQHLSRLASRAPLSHRAIAVQLGVSGLAKTGAFSVNYVPPMQEQGHMHFATRGVPRWFSYTHPTRVLPDLAPQDRDIIEFYAPVSGVASVAYWSRAMTESIVESYMKALVSRLPRLQVEVIRVIDPKEFANAHNLYEGALYGIAPGAPPNKLFPHRSPIEGLYFAGQTTFPGYGVPSVMFSSIQAANALMKATGQKLARFRG